MRYIPGTMTLPPGEPDSPNAVAAWVRERSREHDPYAAVSDASDAHTIEHGPDCTVYATSSGPLLGALAAATHAERILEVGTGLGYSTLWLADGAAPDGIVDSIERDLTHIDLARGVFAQHGVSARIRLHHGSAIEVLPRLPGPYDLIFSDSDVDEYADTLQHFIRLLRTGGLLITSNLFLGQYTADVPGIEQAIAYRQRIITDARLRTAFTPTGLALSVRV
jgi:predicted O-methyltransferase YrrM